MMRIEQQVCSLELAKRLRGLGVKQDSVFYWHNGKIACPQFQEYNIVPSNWIAAFTVAELGEMLPLWHETVKREDKDFVCIIRDRNSDNNYHAFDENEADARAKMLIYLIENKLLVL